VLEREETEGENLEHTLEGDSVRPMFQTFGGRSVYGGGGITPDYVVKFENLSGITASISRRDLFYQFVSSYLSGEGTSLRAQYSSDFRTFKRSFEISQNVLSQFRSFVETREIKIDEKEFATDSKYIKARLKATIARSFWGNDGWFPIMLEVDSQFKKAMTLFPEAEKIAKLN
jgi:carboxyl-terminal processing protease